MEFEPTNKPAGTFTIAHADGTTTEHVFYNAFSPEALGAIFDEINAEDDDPADSWKK